MPRGKINVSHPASYPSASRLLRRLTFVWTADESGNADGEFTPTQSGELVRVISVPGGGTLRPRVGYGIALVNRSGLDVLGGRGQDQPAERLMDLGPAGILRDPLELRVSGAGPGASGRVILYFRNRQPETSSSQGE